LRDPSTALSNYERFIDFSNDPMRNYEVQKRVANIYFEQQRDAKRAIDSYRKLLESNPKSLEADFFKFRVALSYYHLNDFDSARKEYQNLVEQYPKSQWTAKAKFEIGNTYFMEGRYPVAVVALKQMIRNHPQSEYAVEGQFLMAHCFTQMGKLENAMRIYLGLRKIYTSEELLELRIKDVRKKIKKQNSIRKKRR